MSNVIAMIVRVLLQLAASLYGIVVRVRNMLFDFGIFKHYKAKLPVICVGNITAGGTGKTPLVRYLVSILRSAGERPVVLSRGYGGRRRGPWQVQADDGFLDVGDEPLMLSRDRDLPVVIARSRVKGLRYIESRNLGTVVVLDDGYQHRWLFRDLNIVCINGATVAACEDFNRGELLPMGIFREPRSAALRRASLVVIASRGPFPIDRGSEALQRLIENLPPGLPWTGSFLDQPRVRHLLNGSELVRQKIVALCAIANPEGFFQSLQHLGFIDRLDRSLPDHSVTFSQVCREQLMNSELPVVITEKDAVKLSRDLLINERLCVLTFDLVVDSPELIRNKIQAVCLPDHDG